MAVHINESRAHGNVDVLPHLQCGHSIVISLAVVPATRCRVGIKSVPAADLATNACAHGLTPSLNPGPSWTVKNTIFVEGETRRISSAAAIPFMPGMLMSNRTMSGFNSITFSMASLPSLASPQTWKECHPRVREGLFAPRGGHPR